MSSGERNVIQEVLNNPQAYGEETRREVSLKAASELMRLWILESRVERVSGDLVRVINAKD